MKNRQVRVIFIFVISIFLYSTTSFAEESLKANTVKEYIRKLDRWSKQELLELKKGKKSEEGGDIKGLVEAKERLLKRCNRIPWYVGTEMKDKPNKIARDFCYLAMEFYNNSKKYIEKKDMEVKERASNQYNASRRLLEKDIVSELSILKNQNQ